MLFERPRIGHRAGYQSQEAGKEYRKGTALGGKTSARFRCSAWTHLKPRLTYFECDGDFHDLSLRSVL